MGLPPVCHAPVDQNIVDQPSPKSFPAVPIASDLASAIAAINALRQWLMQQQQQQQNNGTGSTKKQPTKVGRFQEVRNARSVSQHKVSNPEDATQFVNIERIDRLTFQDTVTGEQWVWSR